MRNSNILRGLMAATAITAVAESALAADYGSFDGVTIEAKLIGGQQYEGLYGRIADWEAATGAKVEIISKKSHFEIDKEIKSDMAAGTTKWCVGSNHSSFAPQYEGLYVDLTGKVAAETVGEFVPGNIKASTVGGELLITADHGNADQMLDPVSGQAQTAHTTNPVPLIYLGRGGRLMAGGVLSDVAPTLLYLMGLDRPPEMNGRVLVALG